MDEHIINSTTVGIVSRGIVVVVPPGYGDPANAARCYPVMYMQDGNNCLDVDPFGHGGWQIDTVSGDLAERGAIEPTIFVLISNSPSRREEYVPGAGTAPGATADGYLDFVARDIVPFVETHYRAFPEAANRGIGGSSFGGLISLCAAWTRPNLFGFVLAMSPGHTYDFGAMVRRTLVKPSLRIYIDSGTVGQMGRDDGMKLTVELCDLLIAKGFVVGSDLQHYIGQDHSHNEEYWRRRLPVALPFLLPPASSVAKGLT